MNPTVRMSAHEEAGKPALRRPTKRELTESLKILRDEAEKLKAWSETYHSSDNEWLAKEAARRANKYERIEKVILWIEGS